MNSVVHARVIVVAAEGRSGALASALARMEFDGVRIVRGLEEARALCAAHAADACLVLLPRAVPDETPPWMAESTAPGAGTGVPSLLLADPVTPHVAAASRKAGYADAIPADTPPRLLYRAIGGLLQQARRADTPPREPTAGLGKLTLQ